MGCQLKTNGPIVVNDSPTLALTLTVNPTPNRHRSVRVEIGRLCEQSERERLFDFFAVESLPTT